MHSCVGLIGGGYCARISGSCLPVVRGFLDVIVIILLGDMMRWLGVNPECRVLYILVEARQRECKVGRVSYFETPLMEIPLDVRHNSNQRMSH